MVRHTELPPSDPLSLVRKEAKLRYGHGDFSILRPGDFVRCAVTKEPIPLLRLSYWSVDRQEPYSSAAISFKRYQELRRSKKT